MPPFLFNTLAFLTCLYISLNNIQDESYPMQNCKDQRILGTEDQFTEKGIRYAWNSLAIVEFMSKDQKSMSLKLSFSSGTTIARVYAKRANNCSCFFVVISFHCSVPVSSSENKKRFPYTPAYIYFI